MKKLNKKAMPAGRQGFTLIELLVVIAIIGLLSTLAVVAFGNTRIKARDAKRQSDLKVLQTAIEMYTTDNGHIPGPGAVAGTGAIPANDNKWDGTPLAGDLQTLLAEYLPGGLPEDPQSRDWIYCYWNSGAATLSTGYMVATTLEQNIDVSGDIDAPVASITWTSSDCITSDGGTTLAADPDCQDSNAGTIDDNSNATAVCLGRATR